MSRKRTVLALAALLPALTARADEAAILADLAAFFRTEDPARRAARVARIRSDPAYDRGRVREWLHRADLFGPLPPGQQELPVPLPDGTTRSLTLRIPRDYDPHRPWPLLYVLHGTGGSGPGILGYYERLLGPRCEQFILAAPTGYEDVIIHQSRWPPTGEHPLALRAVKQRVHIDSDRVFISGYSRGGHATWTVAVLHADQFAGAMPLAGTFTLLMRERMWDVFLPNLAHTHVLGVWGAEDRLDQNGSASRHGGIAGLNRKCRDLAASLGLHLTLVELPDRGHGDVVPPPAELEQLLARTRGPCPPEVQHTFRHICQAQAYWLEGHAWRGARWTGRRVTVRLREDELIFRDEDVDEAALRTYRGLLGELRGRIDGQRIDVRRKKVSDLTVWLSDGMIDWEQPVVLAVSGREVFRGRVAPDLHVCLAQAARTRDFDRLRWAGLRFQSGGKTQPVTPATRFPTLFELLQAEPDEPE